MTDPILPASTSLLTPAIDQIVARRPEALAFFNAGSRWADIPAAWKAQYLPNLARLADEVKSARLDFAKGAALRSLCASEFNTTLPTTPTSAVGTVLLTRDPGRAAGVIKAGTKFVKLADPNGLPVPIPAATYTSISTVYCPHGSNSATVNIAASTPGPDANQPSWLNTITPIVLAQPLAFDNTWVSALVSASGGSSGSTDAALIAASKAYAIGQFGPTDGAIISGLLRQAGVRRYAVFPASNGIPYASAYIADESWASSPYWVSSVAQQMADAWQGFGCRLRIGVVVNEPVAVSASITLTSTDALNFTDAIDVNVRAAAQSYFDDRPDWYRWRANSLQASITASDPRILQCTSVAVTDPVGGFPVGEVSWPYGQAWNSQATHFWLTDRNMTTTYSPPS